MSFHPDSHLPHCMMPDGGECCAGYAAICEDWHKQHDRIEKLEKALHDLYEFCAKQNEIRLDSRVMRQVRAALEQEKPTDV
jgi:hypothetical protein